MAQYDHPAKTQFIQQQHQQDMRGSESIRQESQAIPAQNPLVPANPYISEGMVTINPLSSHLCDSRKYPYPSHGWFFRLDPSTPSEFPFQRGHV